MCTRTYLYTNRLSRGNQLNWQGPDWCLECNGPDWCLEWKWPEWCLAFTDPNERDLSRDSKLLATVTL